MYKSLVQFSQPTLKFSTQTVTKLIVCWANRSFSDVRKYPENINMTTQKALAQGSTFPPTKPGVLRIYSMRFCPFAQRTRLVLQHKNIPHETVNINLKSKPDWFLALNPLGQVPVLQLDDKVIAESTATCDWLDDVYPENRLQPADPYRRAWDRVLLEYASKLGGPFMGVARATEEAELQKSWEDLLRHVKFYEDKLAERKEGPYFGGAKPAMFDFHFWPFFERFDGLSTLKDNPAVTFPREKFPALAAYRDAMVGRPDVKAIMFDAQSHATFTKKAATGNPDYDLGLEE